MQTTVRPSPAIAAQLRDRNVGHAVVMAVLPRDLGADPRSAVDALWRYDPADGTLVVQASCPIRTDLIGEVLVTSPEPTPEVGTRWHIDVEMNCQKTPPSQVPVELRAALKAGGRAYRSRSVVVPEDERASWCLKRLARHGLELDPEPLQIGELRYADLGRRGGGIPFVRVRGTGTVVDSAAWTAALTRGIGRGRSFGLSLVLTQPASDAAGSTTTRTTKGNPS